MMSNRELSERGIRAYARALAVADPIRLRFWDGRGLTMAQLRVLLIAVEPKGATVSEIAARMHVTPATITGLTSRLLRRKLIRRREDDADRRRIRVEATESGREVVREIDVASHAYLEAIFARMGEERVRALVEALSTFTDAARSLGETELGV